MRVPVLSEQMTDVHPSVSTDGRLRTIAFFFAILRVPTTLKTLSIIGLIPVSSIYVWSENFSHSAYEKSESKMAEIDVQ